MRQPHSKYWVLGDIGFLLLLAALGLFFAGLVAAFMKQLPIHNPHALVAALCGVCLLGVLGVWLMQVFGSKIYEFLVNPPDQFR